MTCLHVNLGQPAAAFEQASAERAASHYDVPLSTLHWTGSIDFAGSQVVGRNAFLLMGALLEIGDQTGILAIGIHSETPYFDCTPVFMSSVQTIVDGYCDGRIRVAAPFLSWSKRQVLAYCMSAAVPIDLTYSCGRGTLPPCNECPSCRDRRLLDAM